MEVTFYHSQMNFISNFGPQVDMQSFCEVFKSQLYLYLFLFIFSGLKYTLQFTIRSTVTF